MKGALTGFFISNITFPYLGVSSALWLLEVEVVHARELLLCKNLKKKKKVISLDFHLELRLT